MNPQEFYQRETRRVWLERLEIAAGASLLTAMFFLWIAVMFSLDALMPQVMK